MMLVSVVIWETSRRRRTGEERHKERHKEMYKVGIRGRCDQCGGEDSKEARTISPT